MSEFWRRALADESQGGALLREIRQRIDDYSANDLIAERDRLMALWREAHPEAAKEVSPHLHPLIQTSVKQSGEHKDQPDERWANDVYNVTLRRRPDHVFNTRQDMVQLGISALDGTARHDWREFQAIKNQLAGAECEAFELYPAESRLLDPSNYYTLWCFPGLRRIKVGLEERRVFDAEEALAPQRGLAE
jgi:hypothetical protein